MLAAIMTLAMAIPVMATTETPTTGTIKIKGTENSPLSETDENGNTISKEFKAYKVLDVEILANNKGFVYTVPKELRDFYSERYGIDTKAGDFDHQVALKVAEEVEGDKSANVFGFATDVLAAAKLASITGVPGKIQGDSYVISDLPYGYYVVEDTAATKPVSALILDTVGANQEINIKADKPSIDKKIDGNSDEDDDTTGDVVYNKGSVGDKVPYKITSKVPDMTGYEKYYFVVSDTLSKGLTFNDDLKIKVGDRELLAEDNDEFDPMKLPDYTMTTSQNKDGSTAIEIVFTNFIQYKENVGENIEITYSATINQDAVIGVAGNPNTVKLTYSNNPNTSDNGDPENPDKPTPDSPTGETPEKEVRTFVTGIKLTKVDPNGKLLNGAKFSISGSGVKVVIINEEIYKESTSGTYYLLKDGTYTTDSPDAEGMDQDAYDDTTKKYEKVTVVNKETEPTEINTVGYVKNGVLLFEGLTAGEYQIEELVAPSGYNLLESPIRITISYTEPTDASHECVWTAVSGENNLEFNRETGVFEIKVENNTGSQLPSTGGIGTTIFYIIGGILVVGAAILLITKKRMSSEV